MQPEKKKTCTYTLDQATLDRLSALERNRKMAGRRFAPRFSKKSSIVRDAIYLLYNFEVLGRSIMHPKEQLRKGNNNGSSQKERNKLKQ